jgi:hypothetical protein
LLSLLFIVIDFQLRAVIARSNSDETINLRHFFTSGQRDNSSDWNASLPGTVAKSL